MFYLPFLACLSSAFKCYLFKSRYPKLEKACYCKKSFGTVFLEYRTPKDYSIRKFCPERQQVGSMGKKVLAPEAWEPQSNNQNSHKCGLRKQISQHCPLRSTHMLWHAHTHMSYLYTDIIIIIIIHEFIYFLCVQVIMTYFTHTYTKNPTKVTSLRH